MGLALERPWMSRLGSVFSSAERKATDAARLIADRFRLSPVIVEGLGENDRSATGYLPKAEFEVVRLQLLRPAGAGASEDGSARSMPKPRIRAAVDRVVAGAPGDGDVAIV